MLTLTRKAGQKIRIGDDIEIVVREIRGRQVRLGISAPEGLNVYREELYQQILAEAKTDDDKAPPLTKRGRASDTDERSKAAPTETGTGTGTEVEVELEVDEE